MKWVKGDIKEEFLKKLYITLQPLLGSDWSERPSMQKEIKHLKVQLQSSWQEFTLLLKDTSAGQTIANKSAWML